MGVAERASSVAGMVGAMVGAMVWLGEMRTAEIPELYKLTLVHSHAIPRPPSHPPTRSPTTLTRSPAHTLAGHTIAGQIF